MPIYLKASQVSSSFKRLSSRKSKGKTHLERTSVLMYFLAFDAVCKKFDTERLDLNPEKSEGRTNRKAIELEFTKLVLLEREHNGAVRQVSELGKVDCNSRDPEKRISSNFLTVPLKKASEQAEKYFYPRRPSTPLFKMGQAATGLKWGLGYHGAWLENLPMLLSEIKDSTPFTDLATFVMRDSSFGETNPPSLIHGLKSLIEQRFSNALSNFWVERIEKEKVLAKHTADPFTDRHEPFAKSTTINSNERFEDIDKDDLVNYIYYLEGVLEANDIDFEYNNKREKS